MRRLLHLNSLLGLAAGVCLLLAWLTGYWTVGALGAFAALCVLAIRNPQLAGWCPLWRTKAAPEPKPEQSPEPLPPPRKRRVAGNSDKLVEQMVAQGREALLLRPQIGANLSAGDLSAAQAALDDSMAIVPQGTVLMRPRCHEDLDEREAPRAERVVQVEGFFLDRFPVTNADYQAFLDDGGYEQMSLWDETIWPAVLGFTDSTGQQGPRFWQNGKFPEGKDEHPVVGVCWYEAAAFARWAGKRLPSDAEWVKAGTWPVTAEGTKPVQRKFPWGDAMDRHLVNLWGNSRNGTVPVTASPGSASVGGIQQLIGNVWEWTSSAFGNWEPTGHKVEATLPLKSIRGGAFDTYFDTQAHCQFQSGEAPLARKHNVGFRCALGFCDVIHTADAHASHDTDVLPHEHEEVLA